MSDSLGGWFYRSVDYTSLGCILLGAEEGFRSLVIHIFKINTPIPTLPWPAWLAAIVVGYVLSFLGDKGTKLWRGSWAWVAELVSKSERLTIHSAYYGAPKPDAKPLNRTKEVRRVFKKGRMLKVENSVLSVTPENDPAYGIGKRLSIEYSYGNEPRRKIERWEGTTFVLPVDPSLEERLSTALSRASEPPLSLDQVFKVERMKADPVSTDPNIVFKNKLRMDITNASGREIHLWIPLWESSLVPSQIDPQGSRLWVERSQGSWRAGQWIQHKDGSNIEYCCIKLREEATFETYVGLNPPAHESVEGLLGRHSTIGTILFPVKIDGKMYEISVPAKEV